MTELRTERLLLRRWRDEDAAYMAAINRDPEVAQWLNRPVDEPSIAALHGQMAEHWDQHGFGPWAAESLERDIAGTFLGFVGVAYPSYLEPVAHRPELGWRLGRASWGRGLATEAALVARDDAVRRGLDDLISIIHPANHRSQRVALKLGMTLEGQVYNPVWGIDTDIWALTPHRGPAGGAGR